ncbi:hypothetical protein ACFE04_021281 [Oxalis oulophora]
MSGHNNRGIKRKSSLSEKATKWGKMTAMELMVTPESLELMVAHNNGETLARIMMRTDVPTAAFVIYQEVIAQREIDRLRRCEFYSDCGDTNPMEDPSEDDDSSDDLSG